MKKSTLFLIILSITSLLNAKSITENITLYVPQKSSFRIAGFVMAKQLGLYEEAGLDVTIVFEKDDEKRTNQVLQTNNAYGIAPFSIINEVVKKKNIALIGSLLQQTPLVMVVGSNSKTPVHVRSLKGKKAMISNDSERHFLQIMLKDANMTLSDVEVSWGSEPLNAFGSGLADIIVSTKSSILHRPNLKNKNYTIFNPSDRGIALYDDLIFTSSEHLNAKPKVVEAFYRASIKGWKYAYSHMYKSASAINALYGDAKREPLEYVIQADALKLFAFTSNSYLGEIDFDKVKKMMQIFEVSDMDTVEINELIYDKGHLKSDVIFSKTEQMELDKHTGIKMCVQSNRLPLESVNSHGKHIGIISDINEEIHTQLGVGFIPIAVDSYKLKEEGLSQGICEIYASHELSQQKASISVPLLTMPMVFITQTEERFYSDFSDIKEGKVAVTKDDPILLELKKRYASIEFIEVENATQGLKRVSNGQARAFVGLLPVCSYYINEQGLSNLKVAGHMDIEMPIVYVVAKNESHLVPILNKAINTIDESTKNKIISKWVNVENNKGVNYTFFLLMMLLAIGIIILIAYFNYRLRLKVDKEVKKRRLQEQMLLQQSKLAGIGEMIGNIAHQWRQPLMGLSALMMEIEAKIQSQGSISNEDLHNIVMRANTTMRFMSTTINDFWNFFSKDKEAVAFSLKAVIETTLNIMEATLKKSGVIVRVEVYEDCYVFGFKNEFSQAVINIISNAKDILIERNINTPTIVIGIQKSENHCQISFEDNAGGIKVEPIERIFEPFVSERQISSSGIGLCMTKNIIEKSMEGAITAENSKEGAKFMISLPLASSKDELIP